MKTARAYAPDRSAPPPPGAVKEFRFPPFARTRLANGLTVVAVRRLRAPLVKLELIFPAGAQYVARPYAGLAALTGSLLDEGTRELSALEIAARVEQLGGQLVTGAGWDTAYLATELESRHTSAGLALLAEVATAPTFPREEVQRLRRERLGDLLRQRSEPSFLAHERFSREVYGDTPYGVPQIGTEESLAVLDHATIETFYRRHFGLGGAFAVAVGDLDPQRFIADVEAQLGGADDRPRPARPVLDVAPLDGVRVHLVDRPGAAQTELLLGHAGVPRSHRDYLALAVMNSILGGKFTSRINLNLRERHGVTYGAASRFDGRQGPGPFTVTAAVANPAVGTAAAEVVAELARMRDEPVAPAELEDSRNYLIGSFPYTLQTVSGLAQRLATLLVCGLPDDYYQRYPEAIGEVDAERVQAVARRHLHPDRLAVVAVGPAAELAPQFASWEAVEIHPATAAAGAAVTPTGR